MADLVLEHTGRHAVGEELNDLFEEHVEPRLRQPTFVLLEEWVPPALDSPPALIQALLRRGFSKPIVQQQANLDDVFLDLTGHALREE